MYANKEDLLSKQKSVMNGYSQRDFAVENITGSKCIDYKN